MQVIDAEEVGVEPTEGWGEPSTGFEVSCAKGNQRLEVLKQDYLRPFQHQTGTKCATKVVVP